MLYQVRFAWNTWQDADFSNLGAAVLYANWAYREQGDDDAVNITHNGAVVWADGAAV